MTEDEFTNGSGLLNVGSGHSIWWMDWGNRNAKPIFLLHGGPGSGNKDKYKAYFDPHHHRVIFHDQRGCGQSTPFGELKHNDTDALVADIEKLRHMLKFDTINVMGGSWGSTLALVYAIGHPEYVRKLLLWGIFAGTKAEVNYIQQGGLATHYPDVWEQYIEVVPKNRRHETTKYYMEKMTGGDPAEQINHVRRWCLLETAAMAIDSNYPGNIISLAEIDDTTRILAILEGHYFINNCFLPEDYIKKNVSKLAKIPIVIVQGRHDHVCPPETAYKLAHAIGKNCHLQIVPGGHAPEGSMRECVRAYAWSFLG